jgi:hypothetical protein
MEIYASKPRKGHSAVELTSRVLSHAVSNGLSGFAFKKVGLGDEKNVAFALAGKYGNRKPSIFF